jgi:hypothetical protein
MGSQSAGESFLTALMRYGTAEDLYCYSAKQEDFAFFVDQQFGIPGYYFAVGGTNPEWIAAAKNGGPAVAGHHSPLFKIDPEPSVRLGIEAMTAAALDLLGTGKN